MNKILYLCLLSCFTFCATAQSIDGAFAFQSNPAKEYALYVPSTYDEDIPNKMMLGLHPLNTSRWDAKAWRDTLIVFAESNGLLLVCPDGGPDGKIDGAIDTAFTTTLVDSVELWYNIDPDEKYLMGFSWGAKTVYTYGLRRTEDYKGHLVIGPAVNIAEVANLLPNAKDEAYYLVHGSQDQPSVRYTPILEGLKENGACVETQFLSGVGHTIDFPNRNNILTEAFQWLSTANCFSKNSEELDIQINIYPNPFTDFLVIEGLDNMEVQLYNELGKKVPFNVSGNMLIPADSYAGLLLLHLSHGDHHVSYKLIKR